MREFLVFVTVALAALLGMAIGFVLHRSGSAPSHTPEVLVATAPTAPSTEAATESVPLFPATFPVVATVVRAISRSEMLDIGTALAAIHEWRRENRDEIVRLVEKLPNSDADFLCLTLGLIPTDEVFDKVNVKARLIRDINGLATPAGFADREAAFRQLERERSRNDGLPPK